MSQKLLFPAAFLMFGWAFTAAGQAAPEESAYTLSRQSLSEFREHAARFSRALQVEDLDLSLQYHAEVTTSMEEHLVRLENLKSYLSGDKLQHAQAESTRMQEIYMAVGALTFVGSSDPYPKARKIQPLIDEFGKLLEAEFLRAQARQTE